MNNLFLEISFDQEDIINKLIPNGIMPLLIQLLCTAVLFVVAALFLFKPVREILRKRADYVENQIKEANDANLEAKKNAEEAKRNLVTSKKEAQGILNAAKEDTLKVKEELMVEVDKEIKQKRENAKKEIEQEKVKTIEEVRKEMINVALEASKHVLNREIDEKDNARLVEDFIKDVVN